MRNTIKLSSLSLNTQKLIAREIAQTKEEAFIREQSQEDFNEKLDTLLKNNAVIYIHSPKFDDAIFSSRKTQPLLLESLHAVRRTPNAFRLTPEILRRAIERIKEHSQILTLREFSLGSRDNKALEMLETYLETHDAHNLLVPSEITTSLPVKRRKFFSMSSIDEKLEPTFKKVCEALNKLLTVAKAIPTPKTGSAYKITLKAKQIIQAGDWMYGDIKENLKDAVRKELAEYIISLSDAEVLEAVYQATTGYSTFIDLLDSPTPEQIKELAGLIKAGAKKHL